MTKHIKQIGQDGLGHQLHGLITTLIFHYVKDYYFDGHAYIRNNFSFEHLDEEDSKNAELFLTESIKKFIEFYSQNEITYKNYIFAHEIYNIPENNDNNTLYGVDNAFDLNMCKNLNEEDIQKIIENLDVMKSFFINNKYLPQKRLVDKNIVIHIRLGDAVYSGRGDKIKNHIYKIIELIDIFSIQYPEYTYYLHTDGEVDLIISKLNSMNIKYVLFKKNTKILDVLSDLIFSDIFVCGVSSLSIFCSLLNNKKLTIIDDESSYFMLQKNYHKISSYIQDFTPLHI